MTQKIDEPEQIAGAAVYKLYNTFQRAEIVGYNALDVWFSTENAIDVAEY